MAPKDINLLFISDKTTHVPIEENIKVMKELEASEKKQPAVSSKPTSKPLTIPQSVTPKEQKQEKISNTQIHLLMNQAGNQLNVDKIWQKIYDFFEKIEFGPDFLKSELSKISKQIEDTYKDLKSKLENQAKIQSEYSNKKIDLLQKQIDFLINVYKDLMKKIPNLEVDQTTQLSRQLGMALGSITALIHPSYAPYFYMAIPQIIQYWRNEDMENFENAMRRFEMAVTLAGTNLEFLNNIIEKQLALLEEKEKQALLPTAATLQLLIQHYSDYIDLYNKLWPKYFETTQKQISDVIRILDVKEKERHNRILEKLREDYIRMLKDFKEKKLKMEEEQFDIKKTKELTPWLSPSKIFEVLTKKSETPQDLLKILKSLTKPPEPGSLFEVIERIEEEFGK
jgi:hypothetical protein